MTLFFLITSLSLLFRMIFQLASYLLSDGSVPSFFCPLNWPVLETCPVALSKEIPGFVFFSLFIHKVLIIVNKIDYVLSSFIILLC